MKTLVFDIYGDLGHFKNFIPLHPLSPFLSPAANREGDAGGNNRCE